MGQKMKFEEFKKLASEKEIALIDTIYSYKKNKKFLIIKIESRCVSVLPLKSFFDSSDPETHAPVLEMPYEIITNYEKIQNSELLFLVHHNNPYISEAIQYLMNIK